MFFYDPVVLEQMNPNIRKNSNSFAGPALCSWPFGSIGAVTQVEAESPSRFRLAPKMRTTFRAEVGDRYLMNNQSGVRICVVGCGHWGKNLLRNFHEMGCLQGFFDQMPDRMESFARQYPLARFYLSYEELLRDLRSMRSHWRRRRSSMRRWPLRHSERVRMFS